MSDLAAVREFVKKQLSSEELVEICHDYFPDVYDEFAPGMASSQRIQLLLDYCQRQGRLDGLLGALRRLQPALYRHYLAPRLTRQLPDEPPPVVDRVRNPRQIFISHAHQDRELAQRLAAELIRLGARVANVPITYRARTREEGKKIGWRDGYTAIWTLLKYRLSERSAATPTRKAPKPLSVSDVEG